MAPPAPHESWMRLALREARRGLGRTSPNPAVGAVIVSKGGELLAKGWHRAAGLAHAEIEALGKLRRPSQARGATLYVTLEPCSTHGRTPPCVEAILAAGFARVVAAAADPNPAHAGRGLKRLRRAGIEVVTGILSEEATALNRGFNKWIVTGLPLVIAKCGMSLDGRITRLPNEGAWITGERARDHARKLRAEVDAILVGAETVRVDNPRLTVRPGRPGVPQPWRIVLTRSGNLPPQAHLFTDGHRDRTLVYRGRGLRAVLRDLGRRQVTSVLIEGGMEVLGEAFDRRLVDCVQFYAAPLLLGGPKLCLGGRGAGASLDAPVITRPEYRRVGDGLILTGDVLYPG